MEYEWFTSLVHTALVDSMYLFLPLVIAIAIWRILKFIK